MVTDRPIPDEVMAELDAWGNAAVAAIDARNLEGASERVTFLVDEWRYSRGPNKGSVFANVPQKDGNFFTEVCFPNPHYADYTIEEKQDAYGRLMGIISDGGS